ncbi:COX15/CtaA family protein [Flavihumibacter petaseus]|uniref:Heme A synthase n=1 Tax=Flavihumibacter petaseus NBRC 106054 TaxID=1220578 RepID=A0A0E9MX21_9BACT|nr:COX15/CtaA family protein [Flavihumibacter petaseus]GAO42134.1 heme A synthase [Flavihumibacter petaseus NBRC 106054]
MQQISPAKGNKAVAIWLLTGVFMIMVQIILGGITRLTGSGLSITEWQVVTGSLPPLNEQQWLQEFDKYRQTPQFRLLNTGFSLSDFKQIFFWEWFHRFWARLLGVVFVIGFIYLVTKRYLRKEMVNPLLILFLLGALQGAVGWIMVASGLTGDAVYVKPTRLAMHFVLALGLLCYTFWFALMLLVKPEDRTSAPPIKKLLVILLVILGVQLMYGALMAGHKAATVAPTWPSINGSFYPQHIWKDEPLLLNLIDNPVTIHFFHRNLAYLILILIILACSKASRLQLTALSRKAIRWPLVLVVVQVMLGILSLLSSPGIVPNRWGNFEWMAQLHQVVAMLLLLSLVSLLYLFNGQRQRV